MPTIHAVGGPANACATTRVRRPGSLHAPTAATPAASSVAIPAHIGTCAAASSANVGARHSRPTRPRAAHSPPRAARAARTGSALARRRARRAPQAAPPRSAAAPPARSRPRSRRRRRSGSATARARPPGWRRAPGRPRATATRARGGGVQLDRSGRRPWQHRVAPHRRGHNGAVPPLAVRITEQAVSIRISRFGDRAWQRRDPPSARRRPRPRARRRGRARARSRTATRGGSAR